MRFTFTIKTKSGAVMTIEVEGEAADQVAAEEKVKRENPTCAVVKVEKR